MYLGKISECFLFSLFGQILSNKEITYFPIMFFGIFSKIHLILIPKNNVVFLQQKSNIYTIVKQLTNTKLTYTNMLGEWLYGRARARVSHCPGLPN